MGQKNAGELVPELLQAFDWALVEECAEQGFCQDFAPYTQAGKAVFAAEYKGNKDKACAVGKAHGFQMVFFDKELTGVRSPCP